MDGVSTIIGLSASLLQLIGTTIKALEYLSDVKDGQNERKELAVQLRLLEELLHKLESKATSSSIDSFAWIANADGPLQQVKIAMETIVKQLQIGTGIRKVVDSATWPYRKRQITKFLGQVEMLKSTIALALTEDSLSRITDVKALAESIKNTTDWLKEDAVHTSTILHLTESIRIDTQALRIAAADAANQATTIRRMAIAEWVSSLDAAADQNNVIQNWQNQTGGWFLDSLSFKAFREDPNTSLLCTGRPGAGKSMIAAIVVQYLWQRFRDSQSPSAEMPGVASIFFNFRKREPWRAYDMLSLLVKQLLLDLHETPPVLLALYDLLEKRRARPSKEDLLKALGSAASAHGITYIVLDALDECESEEREELMEALFSVQKETDIRLMATGRDIPEVTELFGEECIRATIRANDDDVRTYLQPRLKHLGRFVQKDEILQKKIMDTIIEAADGMFLLARLHLEALQGQNSKRDIKVALESLPKGGNSIGLAYKDNITRIDSQMAQRRDLARMAIIWTKYSRGLLRVKQLREALSIQLGDDELDEDGLPDLELIVDVCCGLLVFQNNAEGEKCLGFVHYTAEEFFQLHLSIWIPDAYERLQLICLTYLHFQTFTYEAQTHPSDSDNPKQQDSHKNLESYIALNWAEHFKPPHRLTSNVRLELVSLLLDNDKCEKLATGGNKFTWRKGYTGMHLAAKQGLHTLLPDLSQRNDMLDAADSLGRTPLSYAAEAGQIETVKCLLEIGSQCINPWTLDNAGVHPIDYAGKLADRKTFDLLRSCDLALSALSGAQQPQLFNAVKTGNVNCIKLIISKPNVDVNEADIQKNTPLHHAILLPDPHCNEITETLLQSKETEVNRQNSAGDTPLHLAASCSENKMLRVLKMLLEHEDININLQNETGQTALHLAAAENNAEIVKVLLGHSSIKLDVQNKYGRLAIHRAVTNAHPSTVELMTIRGDDVNAKDAHGRTPLHMAIFWERPQVGLTLVKTPGINVNIVDAWDQTPLMRAAAKGILELVQAIVEDPHVDLTMKDKDGRFATWHAQRFGFSDIYSAIEEAGRSKGLTMDTYIAAEADSPNSESRDSAV